MKKHEFNELSFSIEKAKRRVTFKEKTPKLLHKYYANTRNSIDAFLNQYLYCSHPFQLNDSIDSSYLLWDFSSLTEELYNHFFNYLEVDLKNVESFENDRLNDFNGIREVMYSLATRDSGLISLSNESISELMWAHYSQEQGFLISLDWGILENELSNGNLNSMTLDAVLFPVRYVESIKKIDFVAEEFDSPDIPFMISSSIKRKSWEYEKEWRLMVFSWSFGIPASPIWPVSHKGTTERKIYYPKEAIKQIVLGKHFFHLENSKFTENEFEYEITSNKDMGFINYLIANFNDRLYFSGEIENAEGEFKRSTERIELEDLGNNHIKVHRMNYGFHQK